MLTADEIIDRLGGTTAVADALDVAPTTVSSWRPVNFIPRWWQDKLLALALKAQMPLAATDFPSRDERKSRRRIAA
ncbi:MAG TPA: hypothetical protein VD768_08735 [Sphingomicrobium sp.]|nr:hypothetical protein [Sphingomicrobium sp.]